MRLTLQTGNISSKARETSTFYVECGRPLSQIAICLAKVRKEIDYEDWLTLINQVTEKELLKRNGPDQLAGPLGTLSDVVKQITSTPTFQLFLAGIDIAERIIMVSESTFERVCQRFEAITQWMPSVTGAGGLFFVPDHILQDVASEHIDFLVKNNKLCSATLEDARRGSVRRYYVPYATPIGFVSGRASQDAESLWRRIHSLYHNARRQPA